MLSIYKNENTFTDNHCSWCCDHYAKLLQSAPGTLSARVYQDLETDESILAKSISFLKSDPKSHKVIMLDHKTLLNPQSAVFELPNLPMNKHRRYLLKKKLYAAHGTITAQASLPSLVTPDMVLPNAVIDHIIQEICKVHLADSLEQLLCTINFDINSSLIPDGKASISALYRFMQDTLIQSAHLKESRPPRRQ
jgi:hypothetical protein